jgi:hypothetical protein
MYLTDKKNGVPRELHEHEELEVLLESFSKQVEEIVNEVENIQVGPFICLDGALPDHLGNHHQIEQRSINSRDCRISIRF